MIPGVDPKVDYAFKKIFGSTANAPVLIDLLNAVLMPPPDKTIVAVEIRNPFNDKEQADNKLSVVDVKACDQHGRLYNVEMQMCATPTYPERVLYYWAKIYSDQLAGGDAYDVLRETISISFLNDVLFPEAADFHLAFQLCEAKTPGLIFSDRQEMHVIELPKFRKSAEELADNLESWCFFLKNAADLDSDTLPKRMQTPAVARAMEVLTVISKIDLEREKYLAAVRYERDHLSIIKDRQIAEKKAKIAEKKAEFAEKKAEIAEDNAEKKAFIGRIHLSQELLKLPLSPLEELFALSVEDLEERAKVLKEQLFAKG